uniref:Uncharacterized protein n=1 Tax=Biomphalaria glabrata TaxID=6526 RepID=A0A2C9JIT7_BIOGL
MSFVGLSDDFQLDDDGILRDSMNGADLLIDDEGILRDDTFDAFRHEVRGQWTDSGFSGDKQSTTSTLRHLQNSFEDLAPIGDESINISELEASKDELSFEHQVDHLDRSALKHQNASSHGLLDTLESTLDKPEDLNESYRKHKRKFSRQEELSTENAPNEMFPPEYYQQLRELGVLVDGVDLSRDSLDEFEDEESKTEEIEKEDKEHDDLIAQYLASEYRREEAEEQNLREEEIQKRKSSLQQSGARAGENFSSASSARTISSHSFPDDNEDYAYDSMSQNLGSQTQSQKTVGDDEEVLNITSKIVQPPSLTNVQTLGGNVNSSFRKTGRGSTSVASEYQDDDTKLAYSESLPRPSSATSHYLTASELVFARQKKAEEAATQRMFRARSQDELQIKGGERNHKHFMPTLSSAEPSHSLKTKSKSKSVSNIARSGPVKPTHMTVSEISLLTDVENQQFFPWEDANSKSVTQENENAGELSTRLTQEAQKRKQATELVQQLQKDYDNLLTKYALAELTIDQMRLGAKITVHSDSPTPLQAQTGVMSPIPAAQSGQMVTLRQSPSQAAKISTINNIVGHSSPFRDASDQTDGRHTLSQDDQRSRSRPDLLKRSIISLHHSITEGEDGTLGSPEAITETVRADMFKQARDMEDKLESFYTLVEQRQLTLEEQEKVFESIKADHETLRRSYLQAKEDYNVLRRSGAINLDAQNFDENKQLEGHLFRLGMRFDEVQEKVEQNMKEKPIHRQPFSSDSIKPSEIKKSGSTTTKEDKKNDDDERLRDRHSLNTSRNLSVDSTDDMAFEQRVQELKSEYNTGMDLYRRLKYTADTPEGAKQIERVILKLNDICSEMPEMFRLSPEIQTRLEKIDQKQVRSQRKSPLPQSSRNSPLVMKPHHGSEFSDSDSSKARFGGSTRSSLGSILPDRMDQPPYQSRNNSTLPNNFPSSMNGATHNGHGDINSHDNDRHSSRSRRSSRGEDHSFSDRSFHSNDAFNTTLPRPRRHAHELKDPKLSALPDTKLNSSQVPHPSRSETSGLKGAVGGDSHGKAGIGEDTEGALAALPGPGKFKQMTKQRAADDADSGFIGSMVGSGVGEPPAVVQKQGERPLVLKLRKPNDESSTITDTSFDRSSHFSGRSQTSSKPHRRKSSRRHERSFGSSQRDASFDEEDETLETVESEVSSRSGKHSKSSTDRTRPRQKREAEHNIDKSTESDHSTPRAVKQTSAVVTKTTSSTSTSQSTAQQLPVQVSKSETKTPFTKDVGVTQSTSTSTATATKVKDNLSDTKNPAQKEDASQKHSSSSLLPNSDVSERRQSTSVSHFGNTSTSPSRPSSRGSPTVDLMHTRSRRTSIESGRLSRSGTDLGRHDLELRQDRAQLRSSQLNIPSEGISSSFLNPSNNVESLLLLPHDLRHEDLVKRGKEYENRSVGSDVEVGSSITTRASSINSNLRLKALQEEIEKLKEGFAKANEKSSQPPPPPQIYHVPAPQLPTAEGKQEPEYYDPFDDPYGFMRMPRRRANSFSGGREREWDEWYWTLPQNRQYDGGDIPLGYAAADAYAEHPRMRRERNTKENVRNRLRQKRMERTAQGDIPPTEVVEPVGASGETIPLATAGGSAAPEEADAMYNYFIPSRFSTEAMRQQMASRGYFTTPSGGKIYSSTGEEADNEDERGIQSDIAGNRPGATGQTQSRPWYQIKRPLRPPAYQSIGAVRAQSHNDIRTDSRNQATSNSPYIQVRPSSGAAERYSSFACPICGLINYHTHQAYVHRGPPAHRSLPAQSTSPHHTQDTLRIDHSPRRMSRSRSRSVPRSRSYTSDSRSRYRVKEYSRLSNSEEEEEEEHRTVKRSRSLSRGRRPSHKRYSTSESDHSGEEDNNLDRSLSLSMDISKLTHKMLGTLKSELMVTGGSLRDYGSTYW